MTTLNYKHSTKNGGKIRSVVYTQKRQVNNYTVLEAFIYLIKALRG